MTKYSDFIGKRFGRLIVVGIADKSNSGATRWKCICDCGKEATPNTANLRLGRAKSCGCWNLECRSARFSDENPNEAKYKTHEDLLKNTMENKGCLEWQGKINNKGYGVLTSRKIFKSVFVHRSVFQGINGFFPEVVMHSCDNPPCINPDHLIAGTHLLNAIDRENKGRGNKCRKYKHDKINAALKEGK